MSSVELQSVSLATLIENFRSGDRKALARLISLVENHPGHTKFLFDKIDSRSFTKASYIIGITGSPGAGKSTLVNLLAKEIIKEGKSVGILSIDPSSPFSGGAFLGDRVRMNQLTGVPGIFIRSIATRGATGGLTRAAFDICMLFEAYGKDIIIVESCGAGQTDYDFVKLAYTVILVSVPGMGDHIQAQKAGIMEIGDIHVVNKMDKGGDEVAVQIDQMLDMDQRDNSWRPPVLLTNGISGEGVPQMFKAIWNHKSHIENNGNLEQRREKIARDKIKELVKYGTLEYMLNNILEETELDELAHQVCRQTENIYSVSERILEKMFPEKYEKDQV